MRPDMEEAEFKAALADRERGFIVDVDGPGDALLIVFGGLQNRVGMPPFEFFTMLQGTETKTIFVRDLDQCWYQRGVRGLGSTMASAASALDELVATIAPARIVTVGTSAGGFASLLFAGLIDADRSLAFGPQSFTSTTLRFRYFDRRWQQEIRQLSELDPATTNRDLRPQLRRWADEGCSTRFHVHYGTDSRLDRVHAQRLKLLPNVTLHRHPGGHDVTRRLRDTGDLRRILIEALGP